MGAWKKLEAGLRRKRWWAMVIALLPPVYLAGFLVYLVGGVVSLVRGSHLVDGFIGIWLICLSPVWPFVLWSEGSDNESWGAAEK